MLDLTTMTNKNTLYEIKMPDGEILTLKLPTQGLLMKLMDIQNIGKKILLPHLMVLLPFLQRFSI